MPATASRADWPRAVLVAAAVGTLFVFLVPPHSYPVGFDVFRSLLIADTWAHHGFPSTLPAAAFTGLDRHFADQQLLLDALLTLIGGRDLGTTIVPPMIWTLVTTQGLVLWSSARLLRPDASPLWIALLPALSEVWMFRCTALRAMLLGILWLLPLVAITAARARGRNVRRWWLGLCTAGFVYSHGAVEVPPLLWFLGAVGARLERGPGTFPWRDVPWIVAGFAVAAVVRPDFPANLWLWRVLNLGLFEAKLSGTVHVLPSELEPLPLGVLLTTEWPFLLAAAAFVVLLLRRRPDAPRRWSLALPVLLMVTATLLSHRMVEIGAPLLLLGLAASWRGRLPRWLVAIGVVVACFVHAPRAAAGADANRVHELEPVAAWLRERARPGDLTFVTDWATSSPLAWFTRAAGLRFTGAIDPVYMWAADPVAWQQWQSVKLAQTDDPLAVVRQDFGARFLVFAIADAPAGQPPGTTANPLRQAIGTAMRSGVDLDWFHAYPAGPQHPRDWIAVDFEPPGH